MALTAQLTCPIFSVRSLVVRDRPRTRAIRLFRSADGRLLSPHGLVGRGVDRCLFWLFCATTVPHR